MESLEGVLRVRGKSYSVPFRVNLDFSLKHLTGQRGFGFVEVGADFPPQNFLNLTPCRSRGDHNGRRKTLQEPKSDIRGHKRFPDVVAGSHRHLLILCHRPHDLNLLGPVGVKPHHFLAKQKWVLSPSENPLLRFRFLFRGKFLCLRVYRFGLLH